MYNYSFIIGISCFKSHTKRAKCEIFNLYHFDPIPFTESYKEIDKITSVIEKIIAQYKKWNSRELNVALHVSFKRQEFYDNVDGTLRTENTCIYKQYNRNNYSSIEDLIRDIFNTMKIADPGIMLSEREVFSNPSIKYWINQWYHEN